MVERQAIDRLLTTNIFFRRAQMLTGNFNLTLPPLASRYRPTILGRKVERKYDFL